MNSFSLLSLRLLTSLGLWVACNLAQAAPSWDVQTWDPAFDYGGNASAISYQALESAKRPWRLCVSYPHMKDPYWLSVNYGMVEEARRVGVKLRMKEAGGYPNLEKQISQIKECVAAGADALIVGTVSYRGLTPTLIELSSQLPVLATVNDIHSDGISAKSGVSWYTMGKNIGDYLAKRHPVGGEPARVAWFPGPRAGGWVRFIDAGFHDGINAGAVDLVAVKWGDSGKRIQRNLIQEVLNDTPAIDYIIGSAPTAEAAVSELRIRQLTGSIQILSTYFTHGVFRGIKRGKILAAPTDSPVLQGRLSIDQAVRLLEQQPIIRHAGPRIIMVDQQSAARFDASESLAPAIFSPTFTVD